MSNNKVYFAWSYPEEKFSLVVDVLARSFAPNWQRMLWAVEPISHLLPQHFPDKDLHGRLEKLLNQLRSFGPGYIGDRIYYGAFENTLRKRKRVTLERYANEIVNIYEEIVRRRGDYQP